MTKKNTNTVKRARKTAKPEILINTIGCETVNDIYNNYIEAKARAGKNITVEDLAVVRNATKPEVYVFVGLECPREAEKKPWYKRIWNRLTGRK